MNDCCKHLKNILALMPGNVFWKDANGKYLGCNNNVATALQLNSCDEIIGKTNHDLFDKKLADLATAVDLKVMAEKKEITEEETGLDQFGNTITYLTKKLPLFDQNNNVVGILGISFDISDRKKMEAELELSKKEADRNNQLKSQFIADMEHDLRTPCSGIAAMTKILEFKEKNTETKEILGHVAQASTRLLEILDSILSFNKIAINQQPINHEEFNIKKVLQDIIAIELPLAQTKKIKVTSRIISNTPDILIGDEHRISRILLNLVNNAIKFTSNGQINITISLNKKANNKDDVKLTIVVADSGIGIPEDKLQLIFDRFIRAKPANKGDFTGTGLGLAIVKKFVNELNGNIAVESKVDHGTKFTCTLPIKLPESSYKPMDKTNKIDTLPNKLPNNNLNVLLIEDDILSQFVASRILQDDFNIDVEIANNGQEALKLATEKKYNLILMDIGLPDINGYTVTEKIRTCKESKNSETLIVALTAHNVNFTKQKCINSGMNDFIMKPLKAEEIKKLIKPLT